MLDRHKHPIKRKLCLVIWAGTTIIYFICAALSAEIGSFMRFAFFLTVGNCSLSALLTFIESDGLRERIRDLESKIGVGGDQ